MIIRRAAKSDAHEIRHLFYGTVHSVCSRDYSQEQVNAWAPTERDAARWAQRQETRLVFVAERRRQLIGFAELEPSGHIDGFYVHKDFQHRGAGTALMIYIAQAAEERGISRLYAEVSITARPFFARHGFIILKAQEVVHRGVPFLNYRMERSLPQAGKLI
jgi:N-acetylglutamate synthase-like GNAT family acetyltransferase